jgi:hypothetical protein
VASPRVLKLRMMVSLESIEAPVFTELLPKYLSDEEYRELQWHLARNPEAGPVIRGTGGFRKVRWADRRRGLLKAALDEEKRQRARRRVARRE